LAAVVRGGDSTVGGGANGGRSDGTAHTSVGVGAAAISGPAAVDGGSAIGATGANSSTTTTNAGRMDAAGAGAARTGAASCVDLSGQACEDKDSSRKAGNEDSERHGDTFLPIPA
jgi:hypothetical protein